MVSFEFPNSSGKLQGEAVLTLSGIYSEEAKRKISPVVVHFDPNGN
jgi:hypothetical protein